MKKLTLLEQAEIELRRRKLANINLLRDAKIDRIMAIKRLLPNYDMQRKPMQFHKSKKPDKWMIGGYGSGKTYTFCAEAIFLCWINAPIRVLLITQTKGNARATTLETLYEILDKNNLHYNKYEDETYIYIEIDFGENLKGKLMIASGHTAKSLKGPSVAAVGIDEPFVISKETRDVVVARARHPGAVINEVFYTGTIEPYEMEWGFDIIDDNYKGDENTFKVVVTSYDNKYATKEVLQRLERVYDEKMQQVYLLGKNVDLNASRVYYKFESSKHVIKFNKINENKIKQLIISFDFNVTPMCAVGLIVDEGVRIQIYEWKLNSSNTSELTEWIIEELKRKRFNGHIIITGDASGRKKTSSSMGLSDYMEIKRLFENSGLMFSIIVPDSNPLVRDRVNFVNNLIEKRKFYITDNCSESILDRRLVVWKSTAEGFVIDKSKPDRTHLSEACDYGLWLTRRMGYEDEKDYVRIYSERRGR